MVVDTEPSDSWLPMISDLEARLIAIRSGPRLETRKTLDAAAERIRIKVRSSPRQCGPPVSDCAQAAERLRGFLINLLAPYRTSVSSSLQALQAGVLLKYRPFFAFLQRLAPRQAHEVQKSYISTAAWYYETGFRRYTRALERIRVRRAAPSRSSERAQISAQLRSAPKDPAGPPDAVLSASPWILRRLKTEARAQIRLWRPWRALHWMAHPLCPARERTSATSCVCHRNHTLHV
jgi:hypothetical protein